MWWRSPLIQPRLRERAVAAAQEQAQIDGFVVGGHDVEHRAITVDRRERTRRHQFDFAARRADDGFHLRIVRQAWPDRRRRNRRRNATRNTCASSRPRRRCRSRSSASMRASARPAFSRPSAGDTRTDVPRRLSVFARCSRTRRCCRPFRFPPAVRAIARSLCRIRTAVRPTRSAAGRRTRRRPGSDRSCGRAAAGRNLSDWSSLKVLKRGMRGLASGRQIHSPLPAAIARPSESWIDGRQSSATR